MKAKALLLLQAVILLAAAAWIYAPVLHGGWIWDDKIEIANNLFLRGRAGLTAIWFAPPGPDYFPLKSTVQWIEWHLFGSRVIGYHLVSLGLHLASAFLFWSLLRRLRIGLAWLGSLLFLVHPLAVESVAWISELKNTLSLPLLLLAFGAWMDWDDGVAESASSVSSRSRNACEFRYLRALGWFIAAMLCKTSVAMLPVILLLYAWWRRGRITRGELAAALPFFAVSLVLGSVTIWFQIYRPLAGAEVAFVPIAGRLAGAGLATAFYLAKGLVPVRLLFIYPQWTVDPPSFGPFLPWLALGAVAGLIWRARTTAGRGIAFGFAFFLVNLAPVLGLVPMAYLRFSRVADHFVYLPLLGLIALAVAALGTVHRPLILLGAAAAAAALACESRAYAQAFRNEERLWTYTLRRNPAAWLADNNLGLALAGRGRLPEAIALYEKALALNPGYAEARNNLGVDLAAAGRLPEATLQLEKAVALSPRYAEAHLNLGNALLQAGRTAEAIAQFQEALRLKPDYAKADCNLGLALAQTGRWPEALARYEAALRIDPDDATIHRSLGMVLQAAGRAEESEVQFRQAERIEARRSSTPP